MKSYRKIKAVDREVSALQVQVAETLNSLTRITVIDGVQLTDIKVGADPVEIAHKLNRKPLGWIVTDKQGDVNVWRTDWNDLTITVDASGTSTISIWVY